MEATNNNSANTDESELLKFFRDRSGGVGYTFDQAYKICTGYADHFELSREFSRLVKLKLIEKREKHYFYIDPTTEIKKLIESKPEIKAELGIVESVPELEAPVVEEAAPAHKVVVIRREPTPPEAKPEPELDPVADLVETKPQAPTGTLSRGTAVTPIALVFFFNPTTIFDTAELHTRTGVDRQVASQTVRRLLTGGYIDQLTFGRRSSTYRWSGAFRYPFAEVRPEDWNWKNLRVEKMLPTCISAPEPTAEPIATPAYIREQVQTLQAPDSGLAAFDAVITRYEMELDALRAARDAFVSRITATAVA